MAEENSTVERNFATVGAIYEDGVSLIFDGETEPTQKHYLCNSSVYFSPGDRVRIVSDSGTYIVEYVVGAPKQTQTVGIPSGGTTGQFLVKTSSSNYVAGWQTAYTLPTGGTKGQILVKNSSTAGDVKWDAVRLGNIINQYDTNAAYDLQFRTTSAYGTPVFQIRRGSSGTWYTIATTA